MLLAALISAMPREAPAATFGLTTTGSTNYPLAVTGETRTGTAIVAANYLTCDKYSIAVPLTAISIETWGNAGGNAKVTIYDHDPVKNAPKTKLFPEVASAVNNGSWTIFSFPKIFLPGGTYWIVFDISVNNGIRAYSTIPNKRVWTSEAYANAFPSVIGTVEWGGAADRQDCTYIIGVPIAGYAKATKATLSDNNSDITSVSFYSHATGECRLAIFSDNSGPDSKLWESGNTAVSTAGAWTSVNINSGSPASLQLNAGNYWLAWQWNSASFGPSYTSGSSGDGNYIAQTYGAFPALWSGGTATTEKWSAYATYNTFGVLIIE